jgi:hypothetical protein
MSEAGRTRVLLLLGSGRSGSTIFGNLLGAADGHFSTGELRYLWERGLVAGRRCACGDPVPSCVVWGPVLRRCFPDGRGGIDLDAASIAAELRSAIRMRGIPSLLAPGGVHRIAARHPRLVDILGRLYRAVQQETGADVLVDSSKLPSYALLLQAVPDVDLALVHLIRDPRAAAWSWQRVKPLPDASTDAQMQQQAASKSTILWDVANAVGLYMGRRAPDRYLRVRYEDFAAAPRQMAAAALALWGHGGASLPFVGESTVRLPGNHAVAGNPNRMRGGDVQIRVDDEWRTGLNGLDKAVATALSAPLLRPFGYPLRVRPA